MRDGVPVSEGTGCFMARWRRTTIMDADSLTLDEEMKLTVNKHSASSRRVVEQMLDLM